MNSTLLATIGTAVGLLVGSCGMWFTIKDRMTKEVEEKVTEKVTVATKIARLEERVKSIEEASRKSPQ